MRRLLNHTSRHGTVLRNKESLYCHQHGTGIYSSPFKQINVKIFSLKAKSIIFKSSGFYGSRIRLKFLRYPFATNYHPAWRLPPLPDLSGLGKPETVGTRDRAQYIIVDSCDSKFKLPSIGFHFVCHPSGRIDEDKVWVSVSPLYQSRIIQPSRNYSSRQGVLLCWYNVSFVSLLITFSIACAVPPFSNRYFRW